MIASCRIFNLNDWFFFFYSLSENAELLKRSQKSLEESKLQVEESLKQQIAHNRSLERQMNTLKVDIFQMVRSKEKHTS